MGRRMIDRTGERFITKEGYEIVIIEYNGALDVTIQFQDEYKAILEHRQYADCRKGLIKNPYCKNVYGQGFIGQGKYKSSINKKETDEYREWYGIMIRGFDKEFKKKNPTYKDVIVDERFYCFQDYGYWREHNYYEIEGEKMQLDKDILFKGNKIYSPDACIFVPQRINNLFTKSDVARGNCPIGVSYHKPTNKYIVYCKTLYNNKYLGLYNTSEEGFQAYKTFKETYIKEVADNYKDRIPQELYEAMYNWKVEVDD